MTKARVNKINAKSTTKKVAGNKKPATKVVTSKQTTEQVVNKTNEIQETKAINDSTKNLIEDIENTEEIKVEAVVVEEKPKTMKIKNISDNGFMAFGETIEAGKTKVLSTKSAEFLLKAKPKFIKKA